MATMNVYAQIDGMKGECTEEKHKDWCVVIGYSHRIEYAFDFRQGAGKGEPEHSGLTITKPLDPSSPMLAEACAKKKKIAKVVLEFMRDSPTDGATQMYFTVTIEDVRVVKVIPSMTEGKEYPHVEEVGFSYQKIVWKQVPASKETQFDFKNPTG